MVSPQSLSEDDRRRVAAWAADCAERLLPLFASEAPDDDRPRDALAGARAFAAAQLTAADEIRQRFIAGRAAKSAACPAGAAAAAQAAGVAHMGARAFGAAAYAARAVRLSAPDPNAVNEELEMADRQHALRRRDRTPAAPGNRQRLRWPARPGTAVIR